MQAMESDAACSSNTSFNNISPTRVVNANMPQPPLSASRALTSLSVPSFTNEHVDPMNESNEDRTDEQQEFTSKDISIVDEVDAGDENDHPANPPSLIRQSSRIQKRKRMTTTMPIGLSGRKKKRSDH